MGGDQYLDLEPRNARLLLGLTGLMFMAFAMTTDAVGVIIPRIIETFNLGMTAAGSVHYATMAGIALAGLGLGSLADRLGRGVTIILGLALFSLAAFLIAIVPSFGAILALLFVSGVAIGVFKTGALALIGDLSRSTRNHTTAMNAVEGFFGLGAILGPLIVGALLTGGASWRWLYVIVGLISLGLIVGVRVIRFPARQAPSGPALDLRASLALARDPHAAAFSVAAMLYVGVETAVYVWMPTLLTARDAAAGQTAAYALSIFFALRAGGRFMGAWLLTRLAWTWLLAICAVGVLACFCGALLVGGAAIVLLPLSGLFMSVIYPTLNSKAISGFHRSRHGAVAGLILFFTCVSAVVSPLAMGAVSDRFGDPRAGFGLAAVLAALLAVLMIGNLIVDPSRGRLADRDTGQGQ